MVSFWSKFDTVLEFSYSFTKLGKNKSSTHQIVNMLLLTQWAKSPKKQSAGVYF